MCLCSVIDHRRHQNAVTHSAIAFSYQFLMSSVIYNWTDRCTATWNLLLNGKYSTWSIWSKKSSCIAGACSLPGTIWFDQCCDKTTCLQCKSEIETLLRLQLFPQRLSQKSITTVPIGIMHNDSLALLSQGKFKVHFISAKRKEKAWIPLFVLFHSIMLKHL